MSALFDASALEGGLFPSICDVQRQTTVGRDQSGAPVSAWTVVYTGLHCQADGHVRGERGIPARGGQPGVFGQRSIEYGYLIFFRPLADGTLPDVRIEDRLVLGTWPDGSVRYIDVQTTINELDLGVYLSCTGLARRAG